MAREVLDLGHWPLSTRLAQNTGAWALCHGPEPRSREKKDQAELAPLCPQLSEAAALPHAGSWQGADGSV